MTSPGYEPKKWILEGIWWIVTLVLIILILLPIWTNLIDYPYYLFNVLFIVIFITMTRWIFFWHLNPLSRSRAYRYVLFLGSIALVIFCMRWLNGFHRYVGEISLDAHVDHLSFEKRQQMIKYVFNQMVFFGVGSIFVSALMPIRLIISNWKQKNRKNS